MTREEQIREAEKIICTHVRQTDEQDYHGHFNTEYSYDPIEGMGFRKGAEWADKHPINVWHDASEEPKRTPILCQNERGNVWVQYHLRDYINAWREFKKYEYVVRWAYISDLLPKGGEE